jgi:ribosomal protein S18 acetylase RimI-like enzyme
MSRSVLSILAVSPEYQGRGVGTMLIREGLKVVDGMGLPAWLGATEVALPLYRKVGFEVDELFEFDMTPYGGNGLTKHILMIRPALEKK